MTKLENIINKVLEYLKCIENSLFNTYVGEVKIIPTYKFKLCRDCKNIFLIFHDYLIQNTNNFDSFYKY